MQVEKAGDMRDSRCWRWMVSEVGWTTVILCGVLLQPTASAERPNILFCISDDQSYAHTGANGDPVVKTPAFDRVAREGVRFTRAFCDAPSCGPSRSAILTGQHIWRLEEAGNIHSTLPAKFKTYPELLAKAGYFVGSTGKAWSPGRLEPGGRKVNPAGPLFAGKKVKPPYRSMSNKDYVGNFADFLAQRPNDKPFCFWLGTHEPHRGFQPGIGAASGKDPKQVVVPPYFPDHPVVRNDLLDYLVEVESFDAVVAGAIARLEQAGELDNTIVVVTSDHGMPFPRAKASLYDAGTHVPLAIRWPRGIRQPGRVSEAMVNLSDLAATFLAAAQVRVPPAMTARSLMPELKLAGPIPQQHAFRRAFIAMERHDGCRRGGKGYPCRALRTTDFLYIKNYEPDRWPAGDPDASVCARAIPFGEVDSSPTKTLLLDHADAPRFRRFHQLAFAKHPAEELYDLAGDPHQLRNVAGEPAHAATLRHMRDELQAYLVRTEDPRATGKPALWDYYPYYGLRRNKDWKVDPRPIQPHPDALPNPHKPGEVDNAGLVPFIVPDPARLPGIVVDETEAKLVGSWRYSTHTPPYVGIGYLHDQKQGKGKSSVTYTPTLPRDGVYEVRLSHCYNVRRATNTPVTIHHAEGEVTVRINQQDVPPHHRLFRSLGKFSFRAGKSGWIRISTGGTDGKYVIADAVQFIPVARR